MDDEIVEAEIVDEESKDLPVQKMYSRKRKTLFYLMGGGNLEIAPPSVVKLDTTMGGWWIYSNDPKNTVTFVPTNQLCWMREWDA